MTVHILHVDDSAADLELVADAFATIAADVSLSAALNGDEALTRLIEQSGTLPDLILLDLNLPLKSGRDVLRSLKSSPATRSVPVLVLTTSSAETDIRDAYELGASAFLTKPAGIQELRKLVSAITAFWVDAASLAQQRTHAARRPTSH